VRSRRRHQLGRRRRIRFARSRPSTTPTTAPPLPCSCACSAACSSLSALSRWSTSSSRSAAAAAAKQRARGSHGLDAERGAEQRRGCCRPPLGCLAAPSGPGAAVAMAAPRSGPADRMDRRSAAAPRLSHAMAAKRDARMPGRTGLVGGKKTIGYLLFSEPLEALPDQQHAAGATAAAPTGHSGRPAAGASSPLRGGLSGRFTYASRSAKRALLSPKCEPSPPANRPGRDDSR
jgi:hypothetical protein